MDAQAVIELQDSIVVAVASGISGEWQSAVVNIEIDVVEGDQTENCLALSFRRTDAGWDRKSFRLPFECYDMFITLRNKTDGWMTCTLEFDATGKYRFSYSLDSPKRLNGIHDEESLLKNYIPPSL